VRLFAILRQLLALAALPPGLDAGRDAVLAALRQRQHALGLELRASVVKVAPCEISNQTHDNRTSSISSRPSIWPCWNASENILRAFSSFFLQPKPVRKKLAMTYAHLEFWSLFCDSSSSMAAPSKRLLASTQQSAPLALALPRRWKGLFRVIGHAVVALFVERCQIVQGNSASKLGGCE
jgi:hypothetical protein